MVQIFDDKKKHFIFLLHHSKSFEMASGVQVNDEVVEAYNALKLGHKNKYMIARLNNDNTEIIVHKQASPNATYEEFVADLPANECRYAVYDFDFDAGSGEGQRNKILFVVWAPDSAKIREKMLYASSKDALRKKLVGFGAEVQATDYSEISKETINERVAK